MTGGGQVAEAGGARREHNDAASGSSAVVKLDVVIRRFARVRI
jgi:hypothetical protein